MKMVPDGYYCSACDKTITEAEAKDVVRMLPHVGLQHNDRICMSGRICPIWREVNE